VGAPAQALGADLRYPTSRENDQGVGYEAILSGIEPYG
jgi:hypothetical protein